MPIDVTALHPVVAYQLPVRSSRRNRMSSRLCNDLLAVLKEEESGDSEEYDKDHGDHEARSTLGT